MAWREKYLLGQAAPRAGAPGVGGRERVPGRRPLRPCGPPRAHRLSATGPSELRGGYDFYCRSVCTMRLYAKRSESSHCLRNHRSEMAYLFCRNDSRRSDEEKKSNGTGPLNPVMPGAALLHFSDIWEALLLELLSSGFY